MTGAPSESETSVAAAAARAPDATVSSVIVDEILDWLMGQALGEPALEALFAGCCRRIHAAGVPIARGMIGYSTLHPLHRSRTLYWRPKGDLETTPHRHDANEQEQWLTSPPAYMIKNGEFSLRRRLQGRGAMVDFPILEQFRDEGYTDYLAYLISFDGQQVLSDNPQGLLGSWCTDNPDGFSDEHIKALVRIQRQLAVAMKVRVKDEIAGNVLSAYLGPDAGRRVLEGKIRRGDGDLVHAIIWYSDMRNSTRLAESMSHERFLELLNDYFECTAGAVLDNGGEVLRFVGDAVLAIFPVPSPSGANAGENALAAVREALRRGDAARAGGKAIEFGVGLHIGDVLYGNIGVPARVEFSVIGPSANEVARLEELTKALGRPVLFSSKLAATLPDGALMHLGAHRVKGVGEPLDVFGLRQSDTVSDSRSDA